MMFMVKRMAVNKNLDMWWKGMGGEAFFSPKRPSQSLIEPESLGCELHTSFPGLLLFLDELVLGISLLTHGKLKLSKLGPFPFS